MADSDFKAFVYKVELMLDAQQRFFRGGKHPSDLQTAKHLEKEVRSMIREMDRAQHGPTPQQSMMDLDV